MKQIVAMLGLVIGILALSACGRPATPAEATAILEPPAVVEATAEVEATTAVPTPATEPAEVVAATPTVEPAVEPTTEPTVEPTREPPPAVTLALITDMFTQYDPQAGGNNWLLFDADGTFVGRHGPSFETGILVVEGTYTLEGDVLTIVMADVCPDGERYSLRFATAAAKQLHFEGLDSTCDYFVEDFRRLPNWMRFES